MAIYSEDWTGAALGVGAPAGWTPRWSFSNTTFEIQEDLSSPFGRRLRITKSSTERTLLSLNAVDSDSERADFHFRALIRLTISGTVTSPSWLGFGARASGTSNEVGDVATLGARDGVNQLRHNTYINGSGLVDSEVDGNYSSGNLYWLTFSGQGSNLVIKIAPHNDPENALSTLNATASQSQAGWLGLWAFATNNNPLNDFLWVGLGTGQDSAPYPLPVISNLQGEGQSAFTASGSVSSNLSHGRIYAVVTQSATTPSENQILNGLDNLGQPADFAVNQLVSQLGSQSFLAAGLSPETTYYWHVLQTNADNESSNIETSTSFSTLQESIRLEVDKIIYTGSSGSETFQSTGVDLTVITNDTPPVVVYHDPEFIISQGTVLISDPAFETANQNFTVVIYDGIVGRAFSATVIQP